MLSDDIERVRRALESFYSKKGEVWVSFGRIKTALVESTNSSANTPMVAALDDIRAIVFGRGDSVTKVQKVQDRITRLNVTKA